MYSAISSAVKHTKSGKGPVLIEAVTFRKGAHTTSDDPSLYRSKEEEEKWDKKDPIKRLRDYLVEKKLWQKKDDEPLIAQYKKEVEEQFSQYLYTKGIPDPDLLIRTSGELRISNFLLWQIAYSEIYITPTLWPDFGKDEYLEAIGDFQKRERRFGTAPE